MEATRADTSAKICENEGDDIETLKRCLGEIEKDLLKSTEVFKANLEAEKVARDEASTLRERFEKPGQKLAITSLPPPGQQGGPEANTRSVLLSVGITKLSRKCEKTKDLARRTTDDTWIQLIAVRQFHVGYLEPGCGKGFTRGRP